MLSSDEMTRFIGKSLIVGALVVATVTLCLVGCCVAFTYFFDYGLPLPDHSSEWGWRAARVPPPNVYDNYNRKGQVWQWQTNGRHEWRWIYLRDVTDDGPSGDGIGIGQQPIGAEPPATPPPVNGS